MKIVLLESLAISENVLNQYADAPVPGRTHF